MRNEVVGKDAVMARVVEITTNLIAENSIGTVTIRGIAKTAGVNHGLIHRHFGSKRNLLLHVVRYLDSLVRTESEGTETLEQALSAIAKAAQRDPRIWRVPARFIMEGELELLREFDSSYLKDLLDLACRERGADLDREKLVQGFMTMIAMKFGIEIFGEYIARSLNIEMPDVEVLDKNFMDLLMKH